MGPLTYKCRFNKKLSNLIWKTSCLHVTIVGKLYVPLVWPRYFFPKISSLMEFVCILQERERERERERVRKRKVGLGAEWEKQTQEVIGT